MKCLCYRALARTAYQKLFGTVSASSKVKFKMYGIRIEIEWVGIRRNNAGMVAN